MSTDSPANDQSRKLRPSHYMRARRPYLYSDSKRVGQTTLTREVLSHHLETLTNQKDEATFEKFAHRLVQKFIAPNLRPQTGPAGGGDGKTDAETYPVAESISLRWYVHDPAPAGERWAFAFSAKKEWRDKVKSDVAAISGTGRGYPRIYFVTNQYAAAGKSAAAQDALEQEHGIPVTILDRTWLLDCVFDQDSLDIAIETLGVGAPTDNFVDQPGPEDLKRLAELDRLEKVIGDGAHYNGTPHALVEDCHSAALLSRGLEKPRVETEGRFQRALCLARQHKLPKLELAINYDWAWTYFFWFEDFVELNSKYDDVEKLAISSDSADDLERASNLLSLLRASVAHGEIALADAKLEKRTADLLSALEQLQADKSRPNNALHAQALALLTRLTERKQTIGDDEGAADDLWDEFRSVIEASDGLGTFPFEQIADALTEVGQFVAESPAFDKLFETITDKTAARRTEGEAARRNTTRGFQKLEKGFTYDAIRWFGRAVGLLVKAEYEDELIKAIVGLSLAFEKAGLYWAARNYAIAALAHQFSALERTGSLAQVNPALLSRWFSTEVQTGRIPYILYSYYLWLMVSSARATDDQKGEILFDQQLDHSAFLGALLIKTPVEQLHGVAKLPDALERLGLLQSRIALLFLMGQEDILRTEGSVPSEETTEGYLQFFDHLAEFGEKNIYPQQPDYMFEDQTCIKSRILGCGIEISCSNNITSISIGEAILGALESLLATSLNHRILPQLDRLHIRIEPYDAIESIQLDFSSSEGETIGIIKHAPRLPHKNIQNPSWFSNWLFDAVVQIFFQFAAPENVNEWTKEVLEAERGFCRSLTFSNVPSAMDLIIGNDRTPMSIDEWIVEDDIAYSVLRKTGWKPSVEGQNERATASIKFGEGPPPEELYNLERLKHTDVHVISPIDARRWDMAKWRAAFFMTIPDSTEAPPVLGFAFIKDEPAIEIFQGLRKRFGRVDAKNGLRIAIIRGVRSSNPHAYAVVVGTNLEGVPVDTATTMEFVSRINIMTPQTSDNLERFLGEYNRHGRYVLAPAHLPSMTDQPKPLMDVAIGKYHLALRDAWEIGTNDPDIVVLDPDDPPVIPPDKTDVPVRQALHHIQSIRARRSRSA